MKGKLSRAIRLTVLIYSLYLHETIRRIQGIVTKLKRTLCIPEERNPNCKKSKAYTRSVINNIHQYQTNTSTQNVAQDLETRDYNRKKTEIKRLDNITVEMLKAVQ